MASVSKMVEKRVSPVVLEPKDGGFSARWIDAGDAVRGDQGAQVFLGAPHFFHNGGSGVETGICVGGQSVYPMVNGEIVHAVQPISTQHTRITTRWIFLHGYVKGRIVSRHKSSTGRQQPACTPFISSAFALVSCSNRLNCVVTPSGRPWRVVRIDLRVKKCIGAVVRAIGMSMWMVGIVQWVLKPWILRMPIGFQRGKLPMQSAGERSTIPHPPGN